MKKPNIVFADIEISPTVVTTWSLYPKFLSHEHIIEDWYIICACWKSQDEKTVHSVQIKNPKDDYEVCKKLSEALSKADAICGQNYKNFDYKRINTRLIYHGLPPLPEIPIIDTLKEIKKVAAFTSNRLDYLAKTLVGEGKVKTDFDLWKGVMNGDKKALKSMVEYCKVDVIRLQQVYERLKPYFKSHPHLGVMSGKDKCSCPKCSSSNLQKRGMQITTAGNKKQRLQCQNCGSWSTTSIKS